MFVRTLYATDTEHKNVRTNHVDAKALNIKLCSAGKGHCVQMTSKWRQVNSVT